MSLNSVVRLRFGTECALRISVPGYDRDNIKAGHRLDALETLISNEPDPQTRSIYVRRFHEIWENITGEKI
jgi:hypothetical protein